MGLELVFEGFLQTGRTDIPPGSKREPETGSEDPAMRVTCPCIRSIEIARETAENSMIGGNRKAFTLCNKGIK